MHTEHGPDTIDTHVGARLRARRRQLHVSQAYVAKALSIAPQQVQKYEHGVNRVSASTLYAIAQLLEVPVNYFFEGLAPPSGRAPPAWPASPEGAEFAAVLQSIRRPDVRDRLLGLARDIAAEERRPAHQASCAD